MAPTNLKPKKKRILPSSKPKSSKQVMDVPQKKQVAKTQHAEETIATADHPRSKSLWVANGDPQSIIMTSLFHLTKFMQQSKESPYDTESEIKVIKRFQPTQMDDDDQIILLGTEHDDMDQRIYGGSG
ncbi:hypothetical protein Tco_0609948 [Tanacetum coccineum]